MVNAEFIMHEQGNVTTKSPGLVAGLQIRRAIYAACSLNPLQSHLRVRYLQFPVVEKCAFLPCPHSQNGSGV
jgi:hypothetical protein